MNNDTPSTRPDDVRPLCRVLLAEDCDSSRLAMELCLRHAGCDPHGARNGRQALELFVSGPFDLVLMDLEMPDMDGHEVTACIRAMERERRMPPTPVIALTAHDDAGHREACRQAGFTGYMVKPATTEAIRRMLDAFRDRRGPAA
jgi:CheY-like chemotaxis protein